MLTGRIHALGLAVGAMLLILAPTVSAAPVTQAQGAPTAQKAVAVLLDSFTTQGVSPGPCNAVTGQVAGCPITPRLLDRLEHPIPGVENGNIVSRSQNPPQSLSLKEIDNNGQTAHIESLWQYGAGSTYSITFVVVNNTAGWQVDDSYCTGNPGTSIYNTPTGPCQALPSTGGTGTPGMPNTGLPAGSLALIVAGAGLAALALGFGLVLYGRHLPARR